jgi:bifunctional hydroxylase/dehydrase
VAAGWADRVDVVETADGTTGARLVRPDGYVAWAAEGEAGLPVALRRWFGAPRLRRSASHGPAAAASGRMCRS